MAVQAAMAGDGTRYYSRLVRKGMSEDRFPGGRSRTLDESRLAAAMVSRLKPAPRTKNRRT